MRTVRVDAQKETFQLRLASLTERRDANQPVPMPVMADSSRSPLPNQPTDLRWDPFDRSLHAEPYAVWKRMRDEAPVYYNAEHDFYALSGSTM